MDQPGCSLCTKTNHVPKETTRNPQTSPSQSSVPIPSCLLTGWGYLSYSSGDVARHHNQGELQESLFGADGFRGSMTVMVGSTAAGQQAHCWRSGGHKTSSTTMRQRHWEWPETSTPAPSDTFLSKATSPNPSPTVLQTGDQAFKHATFFFQVNGPGTQKRILPDLVTIQDSVDTEAPT